MMRLVKITKKLPLILSLIVLSFASYSQDTLIDPYSNNRMFLTIDLGVSSNIANDKNTQFGEYYLTEKNQYTALNFGILYTKPNLFNTPDFLFKTGLLLTNNNTKLTDSIGTDLTFSELNFAIPVMIGVRTAINYNRQQDRFYKAVNMNIGGYVSFPTLQYLSNDKYDKTFGNYLKFGLIAEIVFTAVNKHGYGHRLGIRVISDFENILEFNKSENEITPTFVTTSLFYVISTN